MVCIFGFINYSNHMFEGQEGMKIKEFLQQNITSEKVKSNGNY